MMKTLANWNLLILALATAAAGCDGGGEANASDGKEASDDARGSDAGNDGASNDGEAAADDERDNESGGARDESNTEGLDAGAGRGDDANDDDGSAADQDTAAEDNDAGNDASEQADEGGESSGDPSGDTDSVVQLGDAIQVSAQEGRDVLVGLAPVGGGYVVVYNKMHGTTAEPDTWAFARVMDNDGQPRGDEIPLTERVEGGGSYATSVSAAPGGGFVVSWAEGSVEEVATVLDVIYDSLHVGHFDKSGDAGNEMVIEQSPSNGAFSANTAVLSDGRAIVTWVSERPMSILAQVEGEDEAFVVDIASQEEDIASWGPVADPNVVVTDEDDLVFAWMVNNALGEELQGGDVFARAYQTDGTAMTGEVKVNTTDHLVDLDVEMCALPEGGYAIGWSALLSSYLQTLDSGLSKVGGEVPVGTVADPNAAYNLSLAPLSVGFVVSWFENVSSVGQDAFVQAFSADGTPASGFESFGTPDDNWDDYSLVTVLEDGDTLAAAWNVAPDGAVEDPAFEVFTRTLAAPTAPVQVIEPAEEEGDAVGSDTCEAFEACGGDPTGSWQIVGLCFQTGPVGNCTDAVVSGTGTGNGHFTFSEDGYTMQLAASYDLYYVVPKSCLDGASCEEALTSLATEPEDQLEIEDAGDSCDATLSQSRENETETEAVVEGTHIIEADGDEWDFCQEGDRMRLRSTLDGGFGTILELQRD